MSFLILDIQISPIFEKFSAIICFFPFFIEVYSIYNIVSTSGVQLNVSVRHIHTYILFHTLFYYVIDYQTLNIDPCAVQYKLVAYLSAIISLHKLYSTFSLYSPPETPVIQKCFVCLGNGIP